MVRTRLLCVCVFDQISTFNGGSKLIPSVGETVVVECCRQCPFVWLTSKGPGLEIMCVCC